ncbi:hypothetical protein OG927_23385 [Streptomyces clavifer]|uniref:hypothetical protein n=1 Tax=Streptomyces clavifer TaxID=68188 RepID=UPI002E80A0C9|nr:hypothetical protein [Streptomyces clavifer]WUC30114.1 hypothetical protein OG927_23385 [Streptomyces clavifer]
METGAILIALIGVCGTLAATWLTQRSADRVKRRELEHAERQRRAEHEERSREAALEARRAGYVVLNTTARQYFTALRDRVHALRRGTWPEPGRDEVEECRTAYLESYAEAQMIVPDPLLEVARRTNAALSSAYGMLKTKQSGTAGEGEALDVIGARIDDARGPLHELREAMRRDLRVTGSAAPATRERA